MAAAKHRDEDLTRRDPRVWANAVRLIRAQSNARGEAREFGRKVCTHEATS